MAGFQGRVRAVSESSLQPVTALASTPMVLFVVAREPLSHWHGFLSRRGTIANFMMKHTRQDGSRALRAVGFY